jgi:hypothetical protein
MDDQKMAKQNAKLVLTAVPYFFLLLSAFLPFVLVTAAPQSNSSLRALSALSVSGLSFSSAIYHAPPNSRESPDSARPHLGFDRNIYPGDDAMPILRKTFAFTSYWLSPPPGEKRNTWLGKRERLLSQGFGFLVLFRGRDSRELKTAASANRKGIEDAKNAANNAKAEGFSSSTIVFLDIEEGGRLTATYHVYLSAWTKELAQAGYRPGTYCSGMRVKEEPGVSITTADDIRNHEYGKDMIFWVYNDACPPSPGCVAPQNPPPPSKSGIPYAQIWQIVRSPRDKETAVHCSGYSKDGNCYAPGDTAHAWFLDVNSATSADPSGGAN